MLSEIYGGDEHERFGKAFSLNLRLNWGVAIAMGFIVLGFSPWLLNIFGNKFQGGGEVLTLTVCFTVVSVACGIPGQSFLSSGRAWIMFAMQSVWAGLLLLAAYFLIPIFKAKGLALSFLVAYSLALILQLYVIKYLFGKVTISGSYPLLLSCCTLIIMALFIKYILLVNYLYCCILIGLSMASIYFIFRKDHTLLQVVISQYKSVIQGRF
jgi:O-antigen/teichoic acid export membrane protein